MGGGRAGGRRFGHHHHRVHHRHHHLYRHRRLMHHSHLHRRRVFWNRRVGFRSRLYGHYWGYNPYFYTADYSSHSSHYAAPALQFQMQNSGPRPKVNFKTFTVNIRQEAVVAPPAPAAFDVACPQGCSAGDQIAVFSPIDGARMVVVVPQGVKEGGVFKVAPPAPTAQPIAGTIQQAGIPPGAVVGQRVAVDTDGDGINDSYGVLHDTDGDGIPDAVAVDHDGDGIIDQFIPLQLPGGGQANVRVAFSSGNVLDVTVPGNVEMNLKMLVDAIESFYEGELAKRFDAQENVEDLDFTVQFAKISEQLQWVNGTFREGTYQPRTMNIVVPEGAKPGQILQVSPPPGYDPQNQPFPVTLPMTAVPGSQLSVVLPEVIPEATTVPEDDGVGAIPTASEYNPHTTVPMSTNADQAVAAGWEFPPGRGTFSAALAANNNCLEIRGCETITFYSQDVAVSTARCNGRVFIVAVIIFIVLVSIIGGTASAVATPTRNNQYWTGDGCTMPPAESTYFCWESMTWGQVEATNFDDEWEALGWTSSKWSRNDDTGTASAKYWADLTSSEVSVATTLGFTSSNWLSGGISID